MPQQLSFQTTSPPFPSRSTVNLMRRKTHCHSISLHSLESKVRLVFCSAEDMTANALTKPLPSLKVNASHRKLAFVHFVLCLIRTTDPSNSLFIQHLFNVSYFLAFTCGRFLPTYASDQKSPIKSMEIPN